MAFEKLALPEVVLFTPRVFGDDRGFLFISNCQKTNSNFPALHLDLFCLF
jgi:dTDP-4-dehydrorhamnose 3,5-epimerase-like enzyme